MSTLDEISDNQIPDGQMRITSKDQEYYIDRISGLVHAYEYEDENYHFSHRYCPKPNFAVRVFPWIMHKNSLATSKERNSPHSIDRFIEQTMPNDQWVFWVDNKFMKPKPVFHGKYNMKLREDAGDNFPYFMDQGFVSMNHNFSLTTDKDLDFTIIGCDKEAVGLLDELFGGHEAICNNMRRYIETDPGFNYSDGIKAWGLEHLLPMAGC